MDASSRPHPTDETLIGFGLGKLDDASGEAVNRHLESCDGCRSRVAALSADSFLGRLRDAKQPDAPSFRSLADATEDHQTAALASPPADETLPPGLADHPDYQVIRELGRGGMGVVYLAHNRLMGRDEVLKVMGRQVIGRSGVLDRFLREIRAVARLRHPNIVAAYHAFRLGESIIFAMEYVDGYDLARMVKSRGPLPVAHAAFFAHQAALGLQHAHEEGMVHRDIKPHNLMLTRKGDRGTIKILDFGLAKATREAPVASDLTHANQMLGTPDFIAPEQSVDAQKADIRADIYSLGCTLYYLLTGGPPFRGTSLYDILQAHHSMDAKPLNFARPEVPVELAAFVAKMMAKEPARRPQTPAEVARALMPFFKKNGATAVPTDAKPSRDDRGIAEPILARKSPAPSPTVIPLPIASAPVTRLETATAPEPRWEGLIDFASPASDSSLGKPIGQAAGRRRSSGPRWLWPSLAVGVLLIGVVAAGIVKVRTQDGVIVLENLPRGADVLVDGSKVRVDWPSGKSAEISVPPGQRGIEVRCEGFLTFGEEVTIQPGGESQLKIALIPLPPSPTETNPKIDFANNGPREEKNGKSLSEAIEGGQRDVELNPWPDASALAGQTLPTQGRIFAVSRDGRFLGQQSQNKFLRIVDLSDPRKSIEGLEHTEGPGLCPIWTVAFSQDGKHMASCGDERPVRIWDITTGKEKHLLPHGSCRVVSVAFNWDGTQLASVGHTKNSIKIWDVSSGKLVSEHHDNLADHPWCAAFSPDGKWLASGGGLWNPHKSPGELKIWKLRTNTATQLEGHSKRVSAASFSPNGRYLASGSFDRTVKVWDLKTSQCVTKFDKHTSEVTNLRFSSDSLLIASSANDSSVRIWEASSGLEVANFYGGPGNPSFIEFSTRGRWILSAFENKLKSWEIPMTGSSDAGNHYKSVSDSSRKPTLTTTAIGAIVDSIQPGTTWKGTRNYLDPRLPGSVYDATMRITNRTGNKIEATLRLVAPSGYERQVDVTGTIVGKSINTKEVGMGQYRMTTIGQIEGDNIDYDFTGTGDQGNERYGKGRFAKQ